MSKASYTIIQERTSKRGASRAAGRECTCVGFRTLVYPEGGRLGSSSSGGSPRGPARQ